MKETKIVELVIADDSQELAIDAISLVSSPAIEQDFVFFGKEKNNFVFQNFCRKIFFEHLCFRPGIARYGQI